MSLTDVIGTVCLLFEATFLGLLAWTISSNERTQRLRSWIERWRQRRLG